MKLGIKCFIALITLVMTSLCVSATDTTTTFKTGPFTVSVDLGTPCDGINVIKPVQGERLGGESFTSYGVRMCGVVIALTRFDEETFNSTEDLRTATSSVTDSLLSSGADKDTIDVFDREINSKPGAVGEGYVPKSDSILFVAYFDVSPKTRGFIAIEDNQTKMVSVLKSIKVTEAA